MLLGERASRLSRAYISRKKGRDPQVEDCKEEAAQS